MNACVDMMQPVREAEDGTYAKARAWVNYMRHAKSQHFIRSEEEPRRMFADMMRRHLKWPLGMKVAVKTPQGYLHGKIMGHLREHPTKCAIDFSPNLVDFDGYGMRTCARVPFRNIKKINPK